MPNSPKRHMELWQDASFEPSLEVLLVNVVMVPMTAAKEQHAGAELGPCTSGGGVEPWRACCLTYIHRSRLDNPGPLNVDLSLHGWDRLSPDVLSVARSCRNPLKGARPVPGPTMITGTEGSEGSLKLEWRTNTGTVAWGAPPRRLLCSQVDAMPSCTLPVGMVSLTTAAVMCMAVGWSAGDEEME